MSWSKREAVSNMVFLGDDEGQKKKVGGLLIATPHDRMYPNKVNYELVQKDGEVVTLSGSASLSRQINEHDVGKFIKAEFTGWDKSANGKFRVIDVNVWEGEPTDDMKKWPRYAEFATPTQAQKRNGASKPAPVEDDDFGGSGPIEETDDLPF